MVYISLESSSCRQFSLVEDPEGTRGCASRSLLSSVVFIVLTRPRVVGGSVFDRQVNELIVGRENYDIMDPSKCVLILLAFSGICCASTTNDDGGFLDKGYRALYRVYEDCQHRNVAVSPCLKKKAITFFERLGRIHTLPITDNLELIRVAEEENKDASKSLSSDLETTLGRTASGSREEVLNDILFDRVASLLNSFNVQIRLPKTNAGELKRSMEEGRGKMKKMMGMMMMGVAMKMAAMVPIAMGVLFLIAGKALIISKIALVLSLIIGLKKLLSQKQNNDHGGWQQSGGGWDRSLKNVFGPTEVITEATREYAQNLAYSARHQH